MLETERIERQIQLEELIEEIARIDIGILSPDAVTEKANQFKAIYSKNFRHQYSSIFPVIKTISEGNEYDAETLLENLRLIRECVEAEHEKTGKFNSIYGPLLKLMDHINLELARKVASDAEGRKRDILEKAFDESREELAKAKKALEDTRELLTRTEQQLVETQKNESAIVSQIEEAQKQLSDAQLKLKEVNDKAENNMTQVVSVLSIFSAIVIAFQGGTSLLGNAITSLQNVWVYKSVLVSTLCGLILFNLVFLMMYIVGKLINRSVLAHCDGGCTDQGEGQMHADCKGRCTQKCSSFRRLRKRLPYVYWVNLVGLIICVLDVIAWYFRIRGYWPLNF